MGFPLIHSLVSFFPICRAFLLLVDLTDRQFCSVANFFFLFFPFLDHLCWDGGHEAGEDSKSLTQAGQENRWYRGKFVLSQGRYLACKRDTQNGVPIEMKGIYHDSHRAH
ncbi:hypothetical protein F4778DRAFT_502810 [Xylariomycetidae sp. FL2044]|nr:hypothetical protein F4778DRAFT_502810 [Xylariomycetidae sp. FL2044]